MQGSSVSLLAWGSAVSESVVRPVAAKQHTHPWSGHTTLIKSVPMAERESFAVINNCAMIISIYISSCPFYYFLRMYFYQKYNVKRDIQF